MWHILNELILVSLGIVSCVLERTATKQGRKKQHKLKSYQLKPVSMSLLTHVGRRLLKSAANWQTYKFSNANCRIGQSSQIEW